MRTLRREFQAFHIEREVLIMLPDEVAQASTSAWLRTADDAAIIAHIRTNPSYAAAIAAEEAANQGNQRRARRGRGREAHRGLVPQRIRRPLTDRSC
jgi:hypothetical protein